MKRSQLRPGKKCPSCNDAEPAKAECSKCRGRGFIIKPKKKSPIKKVSSKRHELNLEYGRLRKSYMLQNPKCEVLQPSGRVCGKAATDLHHRKGRAKYFLDARTYLSACRECHSFIHTVEPGWAHRMGYLVKASSQKDIEPPSKVFLPYEQENKTES